MNMLATIAPKSNQLNADDLIGRELTITVSHVKMSGNAEQPVALHFEGDGGKPFYPCKSMRRVIVHAWHEDAKAYVGRSMTLYRDPEVVFSGLKVGGIRISHMSHISDKLTMALTATRGNKKAYTVKPLKMAEPSGTVAAQPQQEVEQRSDQRAPTPEEIADRIVADMRASTSTDDLADLYGSGKTGDQIRWLRDRRPDLWQRVEDARAARWGELAGVAA